MSPDEMERQALYEALARETDPHAVQTLLFQLDRMIDRQIKRARVVPTTERR